MKKIFVCVFVFFIVFVIYLSTMDKKVYYLSLGDGPLYNYDSSGKKVYGYSYYVSKYLDKEGVLEKYIHEYSESDSRITDLVRDISMNKKYGNYTLKNSLVKADLVTLSINASDVYNRIVLGDYNEVYNYIDGLCKDFDSLLKIMREYCKEDIVFTGYINPFFKMNNGDIQDVVDYLNRRYKQICDDYGVIFVDMSDIDFNGDYNGILYFDGDDYKNIGDKVVKIVSEKLFEG